MTVDDKNLWNVIFWIKELCNLGYAQYFAIIMTQLFENWVEIKFNGLD